MRKHFLDTLAFLGGKATNKKLLELLSGADGAWDKVTYNHIKNQLKAEGLIVLGRGRGGTVKL